MTRRREHSGRRAVALVYLFQVCGMMTILLGLVTWGIITQMDVQRRLVRAADRRITRQTFLRQLRADLAEARDLGVTHFQNAMRTHVSIKTTDGEITYDIEGISEFDHVDRSQEPLGYPKFRLTRGTANDEPRSWILEGQSLRFTLPPDTTRPVLCVEFELESTYGGGQRFIKRYATTLIAGGRP